MAKFKNRLSYLLALVAPIFSASVIADDEPKTAGSEEEAANSASGSLSAGAIAAAVAAAAAIAAAIDSGDGGGAAPAPTPAPTVAPTPEPTAAPTPAPTAAPTPEPTAAPTPAPTEVYEYTSDVTVASATTTNSATQSQTTSQTMTNSSTIANVASAQAVNSNTSSSTSTVTLTMTDTDPSDGLFNNPTVATEAIITELDSGNAGYDVVTVVQDESTSVMADQEVQVLVEIDTHEDRAVTLEIETTVDVVEQVTATATRNVQ
jgi:hypothetical protein